MSQRFYFLVLLFSSDIYSGNTTSNGPKPKQNCQRCIEIPPSLIKDCIENHLNNTCKSTIVKTCPMEVAGIIKSYIDVSKKKWVQGKTFPALVETIGRGKCNLSVHGLAALNNSILVAVYGTNTSEEVPVTTKILNLRNGKHDDISTERAHCINPDMIKVPTNIFVASLKRIFWYQYSFTKVDNNNGLKVSLNKHPDSCMIGASIGNEGQVAIAKRSGDIYIEDQAGKEISKMSVQHPDDSEAQSNDSTQGVACNAKIKYRANTDSCFAWNKEHLITAISAISATKIAVGTNRGNICLFDKNETGWVQNPKPLRTGGCIAKLVSLSNGNIVSSSDLVKRTAGNKPIFFGGIHVWDSRHLKHLREIEIIEPIIPYLILDQCNGTIIDIVSLEPTEENHVAIATDDGVHVVNTASGKTMHVLRDPRKPRPLTFQKFEGITALVPGKNYLAVGLASGEIQTWHAKCEYCVK